MPIHSDTVLVRHELHLGQVSEVLGVDLAILQMLNPKYRRKILPAAGGPYDLRLPEEKISSFITYQDSIQSFKQGVYLAKNNMDKEPTRAGKSKTKTKVAEDSPANGETSITYIVKSGDNLGAISAKYKVTVNELKDWNGLKGTNLRIGQSLTVYAPKSSTDATGSTKAVAIAANEPKQVKETSTQIVEQPSAKTPAGPSDQFVLYTVRKGDNLWNIAQRYPGTSHEDIMKLNQMTGSKLQTGQILKIKRKEG
jgi:membrane-bound lytic murein transglycosylase D